MRGKITGHKRVGLTHSGKPYYFYVHYLVAIAFIGPRPSPLHEVAHWDGCPANNNALGNLRWATHRENVEDLVRHGSLKGELNPAAVLTATDVRRVREMLRAGITQVKIVREMGVSRAAIYRIKAGKAWCNVA